MTRKQKAALKNFLLEVACSVGFALAMSIFIIGACEGWW